MSTNTDKPAIGMPTVSEALAARGIKVVRPEEQIRTRVSGNSGEQKVQRRVQQPQQSTPFGQKPAAEGSGGEGGEGEGKPAEASPSKETVAFVMSKLFGDGSKKRTKPKDGESGAGDQGGGQDAGKKGEAAGDGKAGEGKPVEGAGQKAKPVVTIAPPKPSGIALTQKDLETVGAAAGAAAAATIRGKEDESKAKKDPAEDLDEDDAHNYRVASRMAEDGGEKYKGLPDQMVQFATRKTEYRAAWEKENPNKSFDWEDEAHADFLESAAPSFSPKDFTRAEARIEAKAAMKGELDKATDRIKQLEDQQTESSLSGQIAQDSSDALKGFQEQFAPDADWDLSSDAGLRDVVKTEKVLGPIVSKFSSILNTAVGEIVKLYDGMGKFRIDPQNQMHRWISERVADWEDAMLRLPADQTAVEGRQMVSRQDWKDMTPAQRVRAWAIGKPQALWIITQAVSIAAGEEKKDAIDKMSSVAESNKWQFDPSSILSRKKKPANGSDKAEKQAAEAVKQAGSRSTSPPSSSSGNEAAATGNGTAGKSNKTAAKRITSVLFQRAE